MSLTSPLRISIVSLGPSILCGEVLHSSLHTLGVLLNLQQICPTSRWVFSKQECWVMNGIHILENSALNNVDTVGYSIQMRAALCCTGQNDSLYSPLETPGSNNRGINHPLSLVTSSSRSKGNYLKTTMITFFHAQANEVHKGTIPGKNWKCGTLPCILMCAKAFDTAVPAATGNAGVVWWKFIQSQEKHKYETIYPAECAFCDLGNRFILFFVLFLWVVKRISTHWAKMSLWKLGWWCICRSVAWLSLHSILMLAKSHMQQLLVWYLCSTAEENNER